MSHKYNKTQIMSHKYVENAKDESQIDPNTMMTRCATSGAELSHNSWLS